MGNRMLKILGVVLILGDIYWVYWLGVEDFFNNFGIAMVIVVVAAIGGFLLSR